ncbi:MAG: 30S ribosomal protein S17 [Candidatus Doudnabacteria bacterium]|nr:30S ribosomal protein S17 [Candidatus Doudnabacteria bacterium]
MTGTVISNKMNKAVIVKVETTKIHPKYQKRFTVSKKYPAHNELPDIKVGDKVVIEPSKPYSKTVHWEVISKE